MQGQKFDQSLAIGKSCQDSEVNRSVDYEMFDGSILLEVEAMRGKPYIVEWRVP